MYDHSKSPGSGQQWSYFKELPVGRAGGGLVYDPDRNALFFTAGAERPVAGNANAVDYKDTWMYSFSNPGAGWVKKLDLPFLSNHMSFVTAKDQTGKNRHYFLAGQVGENEWSGNVKSNYEWDAVNETWIKRKDLPVARGHAASSTRAIGCGFIIAGGAVNGGKTKDVTYYDIPSDSWTKIGDLPNFVNTPVCDIDFAGGYFYCESGYVNGSFSYRIKITV